jgi:hypothetical protein
MLRQPQRIERMTHFFAVSDQVVGIGFLLSSVLLLAAFVAQGYVTRQRDPLRILGRQTDRLIGQTPGPSLRVAVRGLTLEERVAAAIWGQHGRPPLTPRQRAALLAAIVAAGLEDPQ